MIDYGNRIHNYYRRPASRHPTTSELTDALREVSEAILASRKMLNLRDNWDGEGSATIAEATWNRAAGFVWKVASDLCEQHHVGPSVPDLAPLPDGSIDVDWRLNDHELLVNVPSDPAKSAGYYGDDGNGGHSVKGKLDLAAPNHWLLVWLTE